MNYFKLFSAAMLIFLICFISCGRMEKPSSKNSIKTKLKWKTFRGVNVGCTINENDVKDLSESNANLMRLSMPICTFMELDSPYTYRPQAFQKLDSVLAWGEKHGISVLIDPHRYPGTKHQWTMLGNDPFWQDFKWHDVLVKFWDTMATRYANRGGVIAGYDLLNEPEVPIDMKKGGPHDINLLYDKLTKAIRKKDSVHTIVYALPRIYDKETKRMFGYHRGIEIMNIPEDDNICLQTHTYFPQEFTHQNIWEAGEDIPYPSTIEGVLWNRDEMEKEQNALIAFSQKHSQIPILVGEFSCPRWTGTNGNDYVRDVIEIAEKHHWSWAYHSYREATVWDAEMSITQRSDSTMITNAPRWQLLKKYFRKNDTVY